MTRWQDAEAAPQLPGGSARPASPGQAPPAPKRPRHTENAPPDAQDTPLLPWDVPQPRPGAKTGSVAAAGEGGGGPGAGRAPEQAPPPPRACAPAPSDRVALAAARMNGSQVMQLLHSSFCLLGLGLLLPNGCLTQNVGWVATMKAKLKL